MFEWFIKIFKRKPTPVIFSPYISFDSDGEYHKENGPAFVWYDGASEYYIHGCRHREDGPAVDFPSDDRYEWYINGRNITDDVNVWLTENNISWPLVGDDLTEFRIRFI